MEAFEASLLGYEGIVLVNSHCDQRVLHAPKHCEWCDLYPKAQQWRIDNGVSFTGQHEPNLKPCPAEKARGMESILGWAGNQPYRRSMTPREKIALDKLQRPASRAIYGGPQVTWNEYSAYYREENQTGDRGPQGSQNEAR